MGQKSPVLMINSASKCEACGYYFSIRETLQCHIHHNHLQSIVNFLPFPQVQIPLYELYQCNCIKNIDWFYLILFKSNSTLRVFMYLHPFSPQKTLNRLILFHSNVWKITFATVLVDNSIVYLCFMLLYITLKQLWHKTIKGINSTTLSHCYIVTCKNLRNTFHYCIFVGNNTFLSG